MVEGVDLVQSLKVLKFYKPIETISTYFHLIALKCTL